jgi:hypothetical protein
MALTFLKNEEIIYMEIWEKSPRLPMSMQNDMVNLNAEDKLKFILERYIKTENIVNLCRAMSVVGFSPIEPLQGVGRDNSIVVFDGIRRLVAAQLLLQPNLAENVDYMVKDDEDTKTMQVMDLVMEYRNSMSEELLDTLRNPPIVEFNRGVYSLEDASVEVLSTSGSFNEDELECPECGRTEFCEGETECGDCGHIF